MTYEECEQLVTAFESATLLKNETVRSWKEHVRRGDVITCGKRKRMVVGDD